MEIPYTVERRADTGVNNVTLGMWLFLASELMLFGGLFSSYVILRGGAADWSTHRTALHLSWAALNTIVILGGTAALTAALAAARSGHIPRARLLLAVSALSAAVFVAVKGSEYASLVGGGHLPSTHTFFAVYFLLTAVHAVHVAGGSAAAAYFAGPGFALSRREPVRFANRLGALALYMYFVDLVWLVLFVALYLL